MKWRVLGGVLTVIVIALVAGVITRLAADDEPGGDGARLLLGVQDDALLTSDEKNAFPAAQGLGPEIIRYNLPWDEVAPFEPGDGTDPTDPIYAWAAPDKIVAVAARLRAEVVFSIVNSPPWANGNQPKQFAPTDLDALRDFCTAAATRYRGKVGRYTIGNEVNRGQYFRPQGAGGRDAPRLYAAIARECWAGIRAGDPTAKVAIGSVASRGAEGGLAPLKFLQRYREAGGPEPDAVALQPYMLGLPPEYLPDELDPDGAITLSNLDLLQGALRDAYGREVPIWLTEFAYRTAGSPNGEISPERQKVLLEDTVGLIRDHYPYVPMLVWFLIRDESPTSYWRSGLVFFDWRRKPAFESFTRLAN